MSIVAVIGCGMGYAGGMTAEGAGFCRSADLLIGSSRMIEAVACPGQDTCCEYIPEKILAAVKNSPKARKIAVLMSGDTGFFSGAAGLAGILPDDTIFMPGISSLSYFFSKLKIPWEDVRIISLHGRKANVIGEINKNRKVFCLLGTGEDAGEICSRLAEYGMDDIRVVLGENLGSPNEKISGGSPADFSGRRSAPLSVIYFENPSPRIFTVPGIPDSAFIRGAVPMTKEEIRAISVSRLHLDRYSVLYDVGAGTGSVSAEAALLAFEGRVFSIEKNPEAVPLLKSNKRKFRADNMEIVEGTAPEAFEGLPAPTHAFIGGSSGNLHEILKSLAALNPDIRVVINAVTLETLGESVKSLAELDFSEPEISCVSAARAEKAGRYHLMRAQNPVYVISAEGCRKTQQA